MAPELKTERAAGSVLSVPGSDVLVSGSGRRGLVRQQHGGSSYAPLPVLGWRDAVGSSQAKDGSGVAVLGSGRRASCSGSKEVRPSCHFTGVGTTSTVEFVSVQDGSGLTSAGVRPSGSPAAAAWRSKLRATSSERTTDPASQCSDPASRSPLRTTSRSPLRTTSPGADLWAHSAANPGGHWLCCPSVLSTFLEPHAPLDAATGCRYRSGSY
ncbi:unnamed protein product [Urochloa humidicola]